MGKPKKVEAVEPVEATEVVVPEVEPEAVAPEPTPEPETALVPSIVVFERKGWKAVCVGEVCHVTNADGQVVAGHLTPADAQKQVEGHTKHIR